MNTASASEGVRENRRTKKHSPVFLAVFTIFFFATAVCVAVTCVGIALARPAAHDTPWFWAAGKLLAHGKNPYNREAVRQIELGMGVPLRGRDVLMVLNPPYTFFLLIPLGLLGAREAVVAWSALLLAFLIVSVKAVCAAVDGPYRSSYLLLAWFFVPAICCIEVGQTGLITLAGLALFLWLQEKRPAWAGAALSLCAVKPHLLFPFGVALLAWMVVRRKWAVAWGAAAALAAESLVAMAFDLHIWTQYRTMLRTEPFAAKPISTLGVGLRMLLDRNALWLEFVPAVVGCAWALWYFWRNRERWDWRTHGSLVTLVSVAVAPYAWITDQVLAIPAILFALLGGRKLRKGSVTLLMAIIAAKELQMIVTKSFLSRWDAAVAVAWIAWYLYAVSGRVGDVGDEDFVQPMTPAILRGDSSS
ncbi:MAG TPA: glycosyltransferase family 87 protein [Acidobacteriaceae bacterium]|nr:glycosyltransferase family 87 protein [Acidobacteriaceae bacterium]